MHDFGKLDLVNIFPSKKSLKNSSFTVGKDVSSHDVSVVGKAINGFLHNKKRHRVHAYERALHCEKAEQSWHFEDWLQDVVSLQRNRGKPQD